MSEARIIVGDHLRATPDGRVMLRLSGNGPATVTLRSARRIAPRWLNSGRPRLVQLGKRRVDLQPDAVTTVTFRLCSDHLALLHRMQTIRATIRVETHHGHLTRRIDLHSPAAQARPRPRTSTPGTDRVRGCRPVAPLRRPIGLK